MSGNDLKALMKRILALTLALLLTAGGTVAEPAAVTVRLDAPETETVRSELRWGLFLEDINHALDGGLYAELVKNRSFEYGDAAQNGNKHGWTAQEGAGFEIIDGSADGTCLHPNNPHYARITNSGAVPAGILGAGFLDGFAVEAGADYVFSVFLRADADPGEVTVSIRDTRGHVYTETPLTRSAGGDVFPVTAAWQRYSVLLRPEESASRNLRICLSVPSGSSVDCDMVSLMPADTFAGLPVRKDLGEMLAAMHPAFLRFPGGCAVEGRNEESIYNWKDSIGGGEALTYTEHDVVSGLPWPTDGDWPGSVEDTDWESISCTWTFIGDPAIRPQGLDIWQGTAAHPYYTTYGLGFYEFFCLCEALDCEPLPVLNAGMTCPVQSPRYVVYPMNSDEFRQCVQDALDLVEFCRGGTDTRWGAVRAAMGHPEPFQLSMIAIGNEQWQQEYFDHYLRFVEAFDAAAEENPELYGDIRLIVANGPAANSGEGWDYVDGYGGMEDTRTAYVDEHFYMSPEWFLENTDRYDQYDRSLSARVFLGEYASQSNRLISALAEAAFMMGMERNGDVVSLACYAPLFGNGTVNQWTPDMIFFNNHGTYATPNYWVQSLFMNSRLTRVLPLTMTGGDAAEPEPLSGRAGLGSWMTSVAYDNLTIRDNATGETLYATDFDGTADLTDFGLKSHAGDWHIEDGRLVQRHAGAPQDENTGDAIYFGNASWTNYTLSVDAEILAGAEGFLIPVCVKNPENTVFWNLGGWGNTVSCLQTVAGGAKSGQVDGTVSGCRLKRGQVYHLEVCVSGDTITCTLDGRELIRYTLKQTESLFAIAGRAENGDLILRMVNAKGSVQNLALSFEGFDPKLWSEEAKVTVLSGDQAGLANSFLAPDAVSTTVTTVPLEALRVHELPAWSLTVIRVPAMP